MARYNAKDGPKAAEKAAEKQAAKADKGTSSPAAAPVAAERPEKKNTFSTYVFLTLALVALQGVKHSQLSVLKMKRTAGRGLTELPNRATPHGDYNFFRILKRSSETDGAYYSFQETANHKSAGFTPGRPGSPPPHLHPAQNETFVVRQGVFMFELEGVVGKALPGQTVFVPAGKAHQWWAGSETEPTTADITVSPAGKYGEAAFETLSGLSRDYGSMEQVPKLQLAVWAVGHDVELTFLPKPVRALFKLAIAPLGELLGYKAHYEVYSTLKA